MKKNILLFSLIWLLLGCRDLASITPSEAERLPSTATQPSLMPDLSLTATTEPVWLVYQFESGISLEYPGGWVVEPDDGTVGPETVWFRSPEAAQSSIGIEIYPRPLAERGVADPQTWMPNESGYEIHWSQPIQAGNLEGLIFIWGVKQNGEWDMPPWLIVVFYDEAHELDIRLTTEFTRQSLETESSLGFNSALASHFSAFYYMAEHIRVENSGNLVTFQGIIQSGSDLGEIKNYCPDGLYFVIEDGRLTGKILLIRELAGDGQAAMYTDRSFLGLQVTVTGVYPTQEVFCEALMCECEDYILAVSVEKR